MSIPSMTEFKTAKPDRIFEEQEFSGKVKCSCGCIFSYRLSPLENMKQYMGFVFPVCSECGTVPESETRRCDL